MALFFRDRVSALPSGARQRYHLSQSSMFVPISRGVVADRYELIEEIGRGGMGVVWRARHRNLGSDCAVKFIHANHAHDAELRQRFIREARAAARLQSPHTVQVLDVDEWQGSLFIAMELLSGESLESRLERDGWLSTALTLEILTQVARGLDKAHAAQLVHRDLKPENIFLVEERSLLVKILDFGIAKQMDATSGMRTAVGTLLGTPAYMSPEQADGGKPVDYRSDLWSLSVLAFRCLTGGSVFEGDGLGKLLLQVLQAPIPAPSSRNPRLSAAVDRWWFSVLQRDPALRPASASELVWGLRQALESAAPVSDAAAPLQRTPKQVTTSKRLTAARRLTTSKQVTLAPLSASGQALPARARLFAGSVGFAALGGAALLWALGQTASAPRAASSAAAAERQRAPGSAPTANAALLPVPTPAAAAPALSTRPVPAAASLQPAPPAASTTSPTIRPVLSDPPTLTAETPRGAPRSRPAVPRPAAIARPAAAGKPAGVKPGVNPNDTVPSTPEQPAASDPRLGF